MWRWLNPLYLTQREESLLHFLVSLSRGWSHRGEFSGVHSCDSPRGKKWRKINFGSRNGKYKEYLAGLTLAKGQPG